jgi:hypothetical protein
MHFPELWLALLYRCIFVCIIVPTKMEKKDLGRPRLGKEKVQLVLRPDVSLVLDDLVKEMHRDRSEIVNEAIYRYAEAYYKGMFDLLEQKRKRNMSDVYVQYHATMSGSPGAPVSGSPPVFQIFVRVPRESIDDYRRTNNDQTSSDNSVARKLSQPLALTRPTIFQFHVYSLGVYYSDDLPSSLRGQPPVFKADGMEFWGDAGE